MAVSHAFELLHPGVQRWIWSRQWAELRDVQERATAPILAADRDVIIAAATASGKTEAAFLPICSALLDDDRPGPGVRALYISPLKALINDQYSRLDDLCGQIELAVHRWHGDVPGARKHKVLADPSGILLITPESLEALFVVHGPGISRLFGTLRYAVIDEIHTFVGTERGAQLRSLLHRIELAIRRRVPRIGLSATLGDMTAACEWLRLSGPDRVEVITAQDDATQIKLQVRGYLKAAPKPVSKPTGREHGEPPAGERTEGDLLDVADHLFATHRGRDGLVFANSRSRVESLTDLLSRRSERERLPNEFAPHHGNLSRELREQVEARLKERSSPITAVCTSTLEMGIDIGSVACVSQIGPPPSVSALRQRLGRSGRRGGAAVMRAYITEPAVTSTTPLVDQLRPELVQTIAMTELLLERWCEPPDSGGLHLSTLVQQTLSMIAQHGGVKAGEAHGALCGRGPFETVTASTFAALLRSLARHDLITQQASDGLLLLGAKGERCVNHYSFYAAFRSPEEYRLIAAAQVLGTLPVGFPIQEGDLIVFAGRRWRIEQIDDRGKTIDVVRSSGGRPPAFEGGTAPVHDAVRRRMLEVYLGTHQPVYLDQAARGLLTEGRSNFARHGLAAKAIVSNGSETHLLVWRGDSVISTLKIALASRGLEVTRHGMVLTVSADETTTTETIRSLAAQEPPEAAALARHVGNKVVDKWDDVLDGPLLELACASRDLDIPGAWTELTALTAAHPKQAYLSWPEQPGST
jgi:ATP-dependent Lhr-like helicase